MAASFTGCEVQSTLIQAPFLVNEQLDILDGTQLQCASPISMMKKMAAISQRKR
jgi:hypothetical protein